MYVTYILYSESRSRFYVGCTSNLEGRLRRHNLAHSGFSGSGNDWEIKWHEVHATKERAMKREREIKAWKSRKMIEKLIKAS